MNIKNKKKFAYGIAITFVWVCVLMFFINDNVTDPNFWFDESGQFFIAKGLNHYSIFGAESGNFKDVIKNNILYNLDPGGFSVILHFWTMISNNHTFLRMLPCLFFVISMIIVSRLSMIWSSKNLIPCFAGFILLFSPLLTQYAFELRPYSMEMLAVVVALYFTYIIKDIFNNRYLAFFAGIIIAMLVTSRYSAFFAMIPFFLIVAIQLIFIEKNNRKKILNYVFFLIPVIVSIVCIYFFTFQYQNPGGEPPSYVLNLMFKNGDIHNILLNKKVFLVMLPFLTLLFLALFSFFNASLKGKIKIYYKYIAFTLLLNCIFVILSLVGKYPWGVQLRWHVAIYVIFLIAWLPLILLSTDFLFVNKNLIKKNIVILGGVLLFSLILIKAYNINYNELDSTYTSYVRNNIPKESKILINAGAVPTIKYLIEYSKLRGISDINYDNVSVFNHKQYIYKGDSVISLDYMDKYNYIILTHFNYEISDLKKKLLQRNNWIKISSKDEPTIIFKNVMVN